MWSEDEAESGSDEQGEGGDGDEAADGQDQDQGSDSEEGLRGTVSPRTARTLAAATQAIMSRRLIDTLFHDLMQECRHSAPGARLSAKLRTALERLPPATRRAIATRTLAGSAPLFVCARRGNAELAEYLVYVMDAPLEQRGVYEAGEGRAGAVHRVTPLWCAAVAGHLGAVRVLADAGALLDAASDSGSTPVRSACFMTHEAVVRELVGRGADIHRANHNGGTCLINSVQSARLCAFLLSRGARVDARDLQLKSALHYAAQEHRGDTARLLLRHGADPTLASRAGDDVLRTAALKGAAHIVALLARSRRYSASRLADAYELLGATQLDEFNDVDNALLNWRKATEIRYAQTPPLEKGPASLTATRVALSWRGGGAGGAVPVREWRGAAELEAVGREEEAMRLQALLVADRVLGAAHKDTVFRLMYRGASYADVFRYQNCIDLWSWALEIRIEKDTLLYTDTWHTACALTRLMLAARLGRLERGPDLPAHRDVLRVYRLVVAALPEARAALSARPVFKKQAETFDRALRCLTHLLYLLVDTAHTQHEKDNVVQEARTLVALDVRSAQSGDTLLHLSVSRLNVIRSTYFADDLAMPQPIFPSVPVTRLLVRCGAGAGERNEARSTPLHVAAVPYNYVPEVVDALLAAGGHLDQVNKFGDSALALVAARRDSRLYPLRHTTLCCLAARALLACPAAAAAAAADRLPDTLRHFLDLHRP